MWGWILNIVSIMSAGYVGNDLFSWMGSKQEAAAEKGETSNAPMVMRVVMVALLLVSILVGIRMHMKNKKDNR